MIIHIAGRAEGFLTVGGKQYCFFLKERNSTNHDRVVDGLGAFSVVGGVVRFELLSLTTLEGDLTQRDSMDTSERLTMSLPAFLTFYQGLSRVVGGA